MNQYLLSIMKGQSNGWTARLIICLLWPFSLLYALGVLCHRNFYRLTGTWQSPKPVISIGNITVGGSGKTPLVICLARELKNRGLKVIILTRGHMPKASQKSDEALMLNEQLPLVPVLVSGNRVSSISKSVRSLPVDVYIADDAFQHWPLKRALDIVAIDARSPFGNGCLLPAGVLREPLSALKRADIFVLTKIESSPDIHALILKLGKLNPEALIVESRYEAGPAVGVFDNEKLSEDFLNHRKVIAFCALGDPRSFEHSLKIHGADISKMFSFMDHHVYKKEDMRHIAAEARAQKAELLVTTHKDAVKLRAFADIFAGLQLVYLPVELRITKGTDEFFQKVIAVCGR